MKKIKLITIFVTIQFFASSLLAQTDSFYVPTASKIRNWEFVAAKFDKANLGKTIFSKVKKDFGIANYLTIEPDGNFYWTIEKKDGFSTSVGSITEVGDDNFFNFAEGKRLKVTASFSNYDNEMCLTVYGINKKRFVNLHYKKRI